MFSCLTEATDAFSPQGYEENYQQAKRFTETERRELIYKPAYYCMKAENVYYTNCTQWVVLKRCILGGHWGDKTLPRYN